MVTTGSSIVPPFRQILLTVSSKAAEYELVTVGTCASYYCSEGRSFVVELLLPYGLTGCFLCCHLNVIDRYQCLLLSVPVTSSDKTPLLFLPLLLFFIPPSAVLRCLLLHVTTPSKLVFTPVIGHPPLCSCLLKKIVMFLTDYIFNSKQLN